MWKKILQYSFSINSPTLNLIVLIKNPPPYHYKIQYYINMTFKRPYCSNIYVSTMSLLNIFLDLKTKISLQRKANFCRQGNIKSATSVNKISQVASEKIMIVVYGKYAKWTCSSLLVNLSLFYCIDWRYELNKLKSKTKYSRICKNWKSTKILKCKSGASGTSLKFKSRTTGVIPRLRRGTNQSIALNTNLWRWHIMH